MLSFSNKQGVKGVYEVRQMLYASLQDIDLIILL